MTAIGGTERVTVVVATRNRRETLLRTLKRHEAQTIVVDNGSIDRTAESVMRAHPQVRLVRLPRNIGAAARNVGVSRAITPYVAFADDDSYWARGSLARAVHLLDSHPRAGLLCARVLVGDEGRLDPISRAMRAAPLGWSPDLPGPDVLGFLGCAVVVRRSAFLAVGGFSELLGSYGEEDLLALDLATAGWGLAYVDALVVHHHPSALRDSAPARAAQETRNRLLTAWLRRPAGPALRISARIVHSAVRDPTARTAMALAACHWLRAMRLRRPVSRRIEQQLRVLETQQAQVARV